jgi:hypothetical protein
MKELLKKYEEYLREITELKTNKQQLELENIDLDSKETMTKLLSRLIKESEDYSIVCDKLSTYETELNIVEKKLSMIRGITNLFKNIDELETYININIKG